MRIAYAIVLSSILTGCGDDTSSATDAASAAWRLVDVGVTQISLMEAEAVHPDRSARLMVSARHCPGDTPSAGAELVVDGPAYLRPGGQHRGQQHRGVCLGRRPVL